MLGRQERWQEDLFVAGPLRDLIPDDHLLKRVDRVLDLSWLRAEVQTCYEAGQGRPGIDPEAAVRLMLAGLFQGITSDRKLLREAQVNLAIRWFAGYRLHEQLPDHSSLTRIRQRWGAERFRRIFERSVAACAAAGLVNGETVHVDATLIRADVSWASLTRAHVERVLAENPADDETSPADGGAAPTVAPRPKTSRTDPEATLATSGPPQRLEPSYKQHTVVDDHAGVIVDVAITTGAVHEGHALAGQLTRVEAQTGVAVRTVTADGAYAQPRNYEHLEQRGTAAVSPPAQERRTAKRIPARRFKYDARHDCVRCPGGCVLRRATRTGRGWVYRGRVEECLPCPWRDRCLPPSATVRTITIGAGYEALLRARRHRRRWGAVEYGLYTRHRWRAEGVPSEAKLCHGLRRAARRRLWNVQIQAYLTAAVQNLKRLAAFCRALQAATGYATRHGRRAPFTPAASTWAASSCPQRRAAA
jgi:transposase